MAVRLVGFKEWYSRQPVGVKVLVVAGGGAAGVVAGVLAAPAIGAAASAAGLGVAAGTLGGAAASSAGLAALGGGAVATGGMGVLGGTAVVASLAGAAGTVATTYASHQTVKTRRSNRRSGSKSRAPGGGPGRHWIGGGPAVANVARHAREFGRRARNGEHPVTRVAIEYAEAFLGQLFREGFRLASDCLQNISDPELRRIVETIFYSATAGALMGAEIGGAVGGPGGAKLGVMIGAGLGTLAGCVAIVVTIDQEPGGERLVVAAR